MHASLDYKCFRKFQSFIHQLTGISVAEERSTLVEGRLQRRISTLSIKSFEEYLRLVQQDEDEQKVFVDLITTNETYCFRTPRIWSYLQDTFLPDWYRQNPREVFKVWSAAASSGEEAYSVGVLCEAFKADQPNFEYRVLGTDISPRMIARCKAGNYSGRSLRLFRDQKPDWFDQHMVSSESGGFQACSEIRSRLHFQEHNLFERLRNRGDFHLVLLRNVLIYFTPADQEKVLSLISPQLAPNGLLIVGESESLAHIDSGFQKKTMYIYETKQRPALLNKA